MNLSTLTDRDLLNKIKNLAQTERDLLTQVLHHLREVERRRLYADLGYRSLFDYAIRELKYSEGQACRRLKAMRLLKEIPEIEEKITSGELSLSNVSQAQGFFREAKRDGSDLPLKKSEKLAILGKLENKSVREAQRELLSIQPKAALPKERERPVAEDQTEIRFLMDDRLKKQLEEVRSLLGIKGATMSYAELFSVMSDLASEALKAKKFGKKRTQQMEAATPSRPGVVSSENEEKKDEGGSRSRTSLPSTSTAETKQKTAATKNRMKTTLPNKSPAASPVRSSRTHRYIPKAVRYEVWQRDQGCCTNCGTTRNLQFDHIQPIALGGDSQPSNLRILCFFCNQRAAMKVFGVAHMQSYQKQTHRSLRNGENSPTEP